MNVWIIRLSPEDGWRTLDTGVTAFSMAVLFLSSKEAWWAVSGIACPQLEMGSSLQCPLAPEFLSDLKLQAACPDLLHFLSVG